MTRINTNISSINAQLHLQTNMSAQQQSIMRLATGLRINAAKDDPAGMVASSTLKTEITSTHQAIANSQRADQLLMTADSALGQVGRLLNEIRGLITEAANSGTMSAEQIAANQLQIDSSLEAIDRLAYTTQFEDKHLLDGSLAFHTDGVDWNRISELQIDQANFGEYDEIGVSVEVLEEATQGALTYRFGAVAEETVLEVGGVEGFEAFTIAAGATVEEIAQAVNLVSDATGVIAELQQEPTAGAITVSSFGLNNDIAITADEPGKAEGDLTVLYTAEPDGNPNLTIDYTPSDGENPGVINVNLRTQEWEQAVYHYNGGYDATSNNAFNLTAKRPGTDFNGPAGTGITFNITDTGAASVAYDHTLGQMDITVDYPNTSVNDIAAIIQADPYLNSLFSLTNVMSSDGTGPLVPATPVEVEQLGVNAGEVLSTAEEVINAINRVSTPADPNPLEGLVTAHLPEGNNGITTVTGFQDFAYYGVPEANNNLQFLAPEGTRPIRFVAEPNGSLEVDLSTDPPVLENASLTVQGLDMQTTFNVEARQPGPEFDDVEVIIQDAPNPAVLPWNADEAAMWDPEAKTLTLTVNFTYRAANNPPGNITLPEMLDMINLNPAVGDVFKAEAFDPSFAIPPEFDSVEYRDLCAASGPINTGKLSGGLKDPGTVIIHLDADADGTVRTTANDLMEYFDNPPTPAIAQQLEELGISMSLVNGSDGTGLMTPTPEGEEITFTTSGVEQTEDFAHVTIPSIYGIDGMFDIRATQQGAEYDDVMVQIVPDASAVAGVPNVRYDDTAKILTIGVNTVAGITLAQDVVDQINAYVHPTLGAVFEAEGTQDVFGIPTLDSQLTELAPQTTYTTHLSGGVIETGTPTGAPMLGNKDVSDAGLSFQSSEYGSDAFVSVKVINGADFHVYNPAGVLSERDEGHDIDAIVNGVRAVGDGRTAKVNTSMLDMAITVSEEVEGGDLLSFRITGGGMQVQLGIDVQATQQARIGLPSIHTSKLGDVDGRLFEIRSGGPKDLQTDVIGAARIVEQVSEQISFLRGRIGAFQSMTLTTNIRQMEDAVESLTQANSQIEDTDFASETSEMTRADILVQSGVEVLSIANNTPRTVLTLLQN